MEQITNGLTIEKSNEVVTTEPIILSEVKSYLGIDFSYHDARLTSIIKSCRQALESIKMVTLIDSRSVVVTFKELYDWVDLPFVPVDGDVAATSINDAVIDVSNSIVGGRIYGNYPDGIKLSYDCEKATITDEIKDGLIRSVSKCFEKGVTPQEAVMGEFKFVKIYG